MQTAHGNAEVQLVQSIQQELGRAGVVLQQFGFGAEADQERLVLGTKHPREELVRRVALRFDQAFLAGADVH